MGMLETENRHYFECARDKPNGNKSLRATPVLMTGLQ